MWVARDVGKNDYRKLDWLIVCIGSGATQVDQVGVVPKSVQLGGQAPWRIQQPKAPTKEPGCRKGIGHQIFSMWSAPSIALIRIENLEFYWWKFEKFGFLMNKLWKF